MLNDTSVQFRDSGSADGGSNWNELAPLQVDNSWYEELNAKCYGMALHLCPHVPIPPAAATAILVAGVVTTASSVAYRYLWGLIWRKGHQCSSASSPQKARPSFLPPIVCLSSSTLVSASACWKPSVPTFRKRQSTHKVPRGCLPLWLKTV